MTDTVRMIRDRADNPPPYTADVHPDEVENYRRFGNWRTGAGAAQREPEPAPAPAPRPADPAPAEVGGEPAPETATAVNAKAVHRGAGQYAVMDDEVVLVSGITKDEALAFNAASEQDKARFIAERGQGAEG